ncbi:hypothetical protein LAZ67_7002239 [Cordylochernes scorpioides]|uniref:DUF5641 domain-containing protein n=1 Tax=Cordylochernes scorpioides TaxID=51811 RepID=A0ABY6KMZ8_9ARAC|nr:hypothetical protein LAZ67_7002239 [Cordylochernes scorpioides]
MGEELKEIKEKIEKLYDELFSLDEVDIDKESEAYDGSMNKIGSLRVSKIFSLRAIKNPSAKCLHEFTDVCNEAIRNLETLELKRNQLVDVILVHFLQQKLSENLRCYYMPHHPEDADYQRILWRPSPEEPVVDYRLLTWRLARILKVYPGSDQKVRVAQVRAATGVYLRPITKLAPLPFKSEPGFSGRGEYDLEETPSQPTSSGQLSSPGSPENVTTTGPPESCTNGSPGNLITTRSGRVVRPHAD